MKISSNKLIYQAHPNVSGLDEVRYVVDNGDQTSSKVLQYEGLCNDNPHIMRHTCMCIPGPPLHPSATATPLPQVLRVKVVQDPKAAHKKVSREEVSMYEG